MRGTTHIRILFMVGVLFIVGSRCQESIAAPTAESVTAHLTGGAQRAWVKTTRHIIHMNTKDPQCKQGEIWTFGHDGQGMRKICENGISRQQSFRWTWAGVQDGLPILKVDEKPYTAEFRQQISQEVGHKPKLITILRTLRTSQAEPVEEITLVFQDM